MQTTAIVVWIYGLLVLGGGVMGYAKAKSKPSLIMGVICGLALLAAGVAVWRNATLGLCVSSSIAILLSLFFAIRFSRTRKFMPGGLMMILSIVASVLILMGFNTRP
jgi:uncharacterized membrane protein (UPF0136 family)